MYNNFESILGIMEVQKGGIKSILKFMDYETFQRVLSNCTTENIDTRTEAETFLWNYVSDQSNLIEYGFLFAQTMADPLITEQIKVNSTVYFLKTLNSTLSVQIWFSPEYQETRDKIKDSLLHGVRSNSIVIRNQIAHCIALLLQKEQSEWPECLDILVEMSFPNHDEIDILSAFTCFEEFFSNHVFNAKNLPPQLDTILDNIIHIVTRITEQCNLLDIILKCLYSFILDSDSVFSKNIEKCQNLIDALNNIMPFTSQEQSIKVHWVVLFMVEIIYQLDEKDEIIEEFSGNAFQFVTNGFSCDDNDSKKISIDFFTHFIKFEKNQPNNRKFTQRMIIPNIFEDIKSLVLNITYNPQYDNIDSYHLYLIDLLKAFFNTDPSSIFPPIQEMCEELMQTQEETAVYIGLIFYNCLFQNDDDEANLQDFFSKSYPFFITFFSIQVIPISLLSLNALRGILKTMKSFYKNYPNRMELYQIISELIKTQPPLSVLTSICRVLAMIPEIYPYAIENDFSEIYGLFISIVSSEEMASSDSVGDAYYFIKLAVQKSTPKNIDSLFELLHTIQSNINLASMDIGPYPIINICEKLRLMSQVIFTAQDSYKKIKDAKDPLENPELVKYLTPFIPQLISNCNGEIEEDVLNVLLHISITVPTPLMLHAEQYGELIKDKIINGGAETKGMSAKCIYWFSRIPGAQFEYESSLIYMLQLLNEGELFFTRYFFADMLFACGGLLSSSGLESNNTYFIQFINVIENILRQNIDSYDQNEINELFISIISSLQLIYQNYENDRPFHKALIKLLGKIATKISNQFINGVSPKLLKVFCDYLITILKVDEFAANSMNLTLTSKRITNLVKMAMQSQDGKLANNARYIQNAFQSI